MAETEERSKKGKSVPEPEGEAGDKETWNLRLYVAGQTERSVAALANLKKICEEHLEGRYTIEVVDVSTDPALAREDQIVALPTLIRKLPPPMRKIIGDLSKTEKVLIGLDLKPRDE